MIWPEFVPHPVTEQSKPAFVKLLVYSEKTIVGHTIAKA